MIHKNPIPKADRFIMFAASLYFTVLGVIYTAIAMPLAFRFDTHQISLTGLLFLLVCDVFLFGFAYFSLAFTEMRFRIDAEGVHVQYPGLRWQLLRWTDCQQVCIANEINNGRYAPTRAVPVICIVKKGETKGGNGRWKMHSLFHLYGVITLSYTEEFLSLVKANCPLEVVDIRHRFDYLA